MSQRARSGPSRIQREIKQTRPFASVGQEAFLALLRTTDLLRRGLAAIVEPHGITLQQYNVLRILRGAGKDGLPTLAIGERMIERAPGVTRLIDRLEQKGLVERTRDGADRRQVTVRIAATGLALLKRLDRPIDALDERLFAALSPAELGTLVRLLDGVRNSLGPA